MLWKKNFLTKPKSVKNFLGLLIVQLYKHKIVLAEKVLSINVNYHAKQLSSEKRRKKIKHAENGNLLRKKFSRIVVLRFKNVCGF